MHDFGKRIDGPGGRRAAPRETVLLNAALMTLSVSRTATLLDVSKTGARARTAVPLFVGQEVWLKINPVDVFGTVAWIDSHECGILFENALGDDEVAAIQARGKVIFIAGLSQEEQFCADDWQGGLMR